jgi:hypothetical protein
MEADGDLGFDDTSILMTEGLTVRLEAEAGAMWRINAADSSAMSNAAPELREGLQANSRSRSCFKR